MSGYWFGKGRLMNPRSFISTEQDIDKLRICGFDSNPRSPRLVTSSFLKSLILSARLTLTHLHQKRTHPFTSPGHYHGSGYTRAQFRLVWHRNSCRLASESKNIPRSDAKFSIIEIFVSNLKIMQMGSIWPSDFRFGFLHMNVTYDYRPSDRIRKMHSAFAVNTAPEYGPRSR